MTKSELAAKGYSIRSAAQAIGRSPAHVSRVLQGQRTSAQIINDLETLPILPPIVERNVARDISAKCNQTHAQHCMTEGMLINRGWNISQAADELKVSRQHLAEVVAGRRQSARLMGKLNTLPFRIFCPRRKKRDNLS